MQPETPHKILVVEDEGLIARDIASRLEALGYQVVATVSTAEEAIERAVDADIVLMDIRLDGHADGVDAAIAIRERYHVPVLFLTAHSDRSTLERAKRAGPLGYIVKPVAHASLTTSIEMAMYKHRVERQLEEREAWMRAVLASVADAVVVAGVDGRVLMLNQAAEALVGWTQAEAGGQPMSKVLGLVETGSAEDDGDPVALAILRDGPVPLAGAWILKPRSGREIAVEGAAAPVRSSGAILGAVLTLRDVSARRWEERQLRQSQKLEAVGRLAAGVSSDYSNLLAIITHQAGQLLRQFGEYSPARQAAEEIEQAAASAERINSRLAAFGTRQVSQQEIVSLNQILRRASGLIESVLPRGVELAMRPDPKTGRVKADAALIEQTLMSLVLHGVARMPEGGRLLIETGNAELPSHGKLVSHAMLAVSYTGFEPEPERLFEPSSTGEEGLALSIVHAIVTEHGGYISAQITEGGGCRLEMLLPAIVGPPLVLRPAGAEARSILLVDDRDRVRLQLHNFFEANGYNLLEAADAGEAAAIGQVHEGRLDVLVAGDAADRIALELRVDHPELRLLRVVGDPENGPNEIRRPYTQQALLARVEALLKPLETVLAADSGR
jgi:two-component system, cell cycle sensor histidine kinase and response regulator CckA